MYMVYVMIHRRSSKQKLNTKITTVSEPVGTSEYVLLNIWIVMFYEAQGYEITKKSYFKIMKALSISWIMDESRTQVILDTLAFETSLLKIE